MLRTFIAFDISSQQKENIAQLISAGREVYPREIKWVEPQNLHFTYIFLGDIHSADQQVVCEILQNNASQMPVVAVEDGQLRWDNIHRPRVLWIEYRIEDREFLKFRKKMIYELKQELPYLELDNREFRCHLTLGRVHRDYINGIDVGKLPLLAPPAPSGGGRGGEIILNSLTFYQSTLTPSGPIYKQIININLSGGKIQ